MHQLTSDLNNAQDNKEFFKMAQEALQDDGLRPLKKRGSSASNKSQSELDYSV